MQIPFIKHGSTVVADGHFCIKYLKAAYGDPPSNSTLMNLSPQQMAQSAALSALALDRLAYAMVYHRFALDSVSLLSCQTLRCDA